MLDLPLAPGLRFGFMIGAATRAAVCAVVDRAESLGFDSLWVGDHVAFTVPVPDPLLVLAAAAARSERLSFGTGVYLLPLRHPVLVAKQVASLDRLTEGRLVFGVGVGGEFPREYEACNVPLGERGARMSESIALLKRLWSGDEVAAEGRCFRFPPVRSLPTPAQPGGPPVWCGGRSENALRRIGRMADGWISYVVSPEMYRSGLEVIARHAQAAHRRFAAFGSGHLLFFCIDDDPERALDLATEHLSHRYAMDFRRAAQRYAALGRPADVAQRIADFHRAGVRHFVLDPVGPVAERDAQLERFAREVEPLLGALRGRSAAPA